MILNEDHMMHRRFGPKNYLEQVIIPRRLPLNSEAAPTEDSCCAEIGIDHAVVVLIIYFYGGEHRSNHIHFI